MSNFKYSDTNKRYHTLSYYYKSCGVKMQKAIVDVGSTCPNMDGTKGYGGCIFCSDRSSYFSTGKEKSISEQLSAECDRIHKKWGEISVLAYFQSGSNTYMPVEKLRKHLDEVLSFDNIKAISVATRPDCIDEKMLKLLTEYNKKTELVIELGLQSIHNETAKYFNRGYDFEVFLDTLKKLQKNKIRQCVHIINGLPNENEEMMLKTAEVLGLLKPSSVKIHLLHVNKNTKLAKMYNSNEYIPLEFDDYVRITAEQIRYINAETVIERVTGDADRNELLAPMWSRDKIRVLGSIDKYMKEHDICQGDKVLA